MSKKKTCAEMIRGLIEQYITTYPEGAEEIEEIIEELDPCINCEVHYCNNCSHWHDNEEKDEKEDEDWDCCEDDEEDEEEEEYYCHPECECVDGECGQCDHWVDEDYCELDDEDGDAFNDCNDRDYECNQWSTEKHKQIEELSKFITSVGNVLGGNIGLLVFDKSNKKDMEKLAAIFKDYAERL